MDWDDVGKRCLVLNSDGRECPMQCKCGDPDDPTTWDGSCEHYANGGAKLCKPCKEDSDKAANADHLSDLRAEFESECAAAAAWEG